MARIWRYSPEEWADVVEFEVEYVIIPHGDGDWLDNINEV